MRYLSLFSGIDAATVAWDPLGWTPVAFAEIDKFPSAVLAHHYPCVTNLGDVTEITDDDIKSLGPIDLVVGGSPCQDLSVSGKRKGLNGSRSILFHEQVRIFHAARAFCGARFLLWENDRFIGVVLFSRGASQNLSKSFGLEQTECCELVRIALARHEVAVSRIVSIAIKFLRRKAPGLKLIISFADPEQGHVGSIYQAGNWIYLGESAKSFVYIDKIGRKWHPRMVSATGVTRVFGKKRRVVCADQCKKIEVRGKYRYAMPLDKGMKQRLLPLSKEYPKRQK